MRRPASWFCAPLLVATLCGWPGPAAAQPLAERSVVLDGETVQFALRAFPPDATVIDAAVALAPVSALDTAKLLNKFLQAGNIEDAALLSNAPRRRFEVLKDYRDSVGDDGFKEVFSEYFNPANRLLAEASIGPHSLLVWHLGERTRYAGQFYVKVEGRVFIDDVPSPTRARLRRLLEAIRAGKVQIPAL